MTFKTPSPAIYFGSLLIAAPIAYLAFWILQTQQLAGNGLIVLGTGVFIGHLVAAFSRPSPKQSGAAKTSTAPASTGETVSLYVGNLAYRAQRDEIQDVFAQYGTVASVRIMMDRATHRPRGYAFVEMDAAGAQQAIEHLDNSEFCGRNMRVSEAKQRQ
jgi:hypothetical protein